MSLCTKPVRQPSKRSQNKAPQQVATLSSSLCQSLSSSRQRARQAASNLHTVTHAETSIARGRKTSGQHKAQRTTSNWKTTGSELDTHAHGLQ
eukprot:2880205-Amphidinium_carterae.1